MMAGDCLIPENSPFDVNCDGILSPIDALLVINALNQQANKGGNHAPVAVNDAYSTNANTTLTVSAPGVLANDIDQDGDTLTVSDVRYPIGLLAFGGDGSFSYTPPADFNGVDSFEYVVTDSEFVSNVATVTIEVVGLPPDTAPIANDDYYVVSPGTLEMVIPGPGVLANDYDSEGDALSASIVGFPNGLLTLLSDGGFMYTPPANYFGTDLFQYVATDGSLNSNVATVVIDLGPPPIVNQPPVANDDIFGFGEDQAAGLGVLFNDTDADGNALTVSQFGPASSGTLILSPDGTQITYVPDLNFSGTDLFTYVVNDGLDASNVATVFINVEPVNDAPVTNDDSFEVPMDGVLVIPSDGVTSNDSDVDGDALGPILASGTIYGELVIDEFSQLVYFPDLGFVGVDSFEYVATDGLLESNVATVTITVVGPDYPIAHADQVFMSQGENVTINALANDYVPVELADDVFIVIQVYPEHGLAFSALGGLVFYQPNDDFYGEDSLVYEIRVGDAPASTSGTVSFYVASTGSAPAEGEMFDDFAQKDASHDAFFADLGA